MCECLDPVQHVCREFGQFKYIRGGFDFYFCPRCEVYFFVPCRLVVKGGDAGVKAKKHG